MKEHKHAEVLRAIADGKAVQARKDGLDAWRDVDSDKLHSAKDPISFPEIQWRVKPEHKPDYDKYIGFNYTYAGSSASSLCSTTALRSDVKNWTYKIKITIDGETNEPKSVELIK